MADTTTVKPEERTAIIKCTCKSDFQDARYGVGLRLHNVAKKGAAYRCTICGGEKDKK